MQNVKNWNLVIFYIFIINAKAACNALVPDTPAPSTIDILIPANMLDRAAKVLDLGGTGQFVEQCLAPQVSIQKLYPSSHTNILLEILSVPAIWTISTFWILNYF